MRKPAGLLSPLARWAGPVSLVALFLALLCWTWRKWPDPLVDSGVQLYNGWQLSGGKLLYRDIGWPFGPLSQYAVAAWFRLAGVSLTSLVWLNLIVLAAIVAMVYRLVSAIAGRTAATAAGLVFVGVFAFGQYVDVSNYNYLAPYTSDATHGMAISLAGLLLVSRYGRTGERRCVAGIGACLGLLFMNKPEYFVSLLAGAVAGLGGILWARRARAGEWAHTGALLAAAAVAPVAAAGLWLAVRMGPAGALSALATPWEMLGRTDVTGGRFYRIVLGFDDVGGRIRDLLWMLGRHAVVLLPAFLIARRCRPGTAAVLIGLGLGAAAAALLWFSVSPGAWPFLVLPLPLEVAAIVAWAGWKQRRSREQGDPGLAGTRLAAAVFALLLLGKIILNTAVLHYGFVLAMPATMLAVSALMGWIPARLDAAGGSGTAFRCLTGLLLAVFVAAHWRIESGYLAAKVHPVGEGPDRFWADRRGANINAAVAAVRSHSRSGSTLLVLPEGCIINYLARRENPGPYFGFLPNGFVDESAIVGVLKEERPDLIAITDRSVQEFGVAPLGFGYGRQVIAQINRDYRHVAQFGPSPLMPGGNGIKILARNDARP